MNLLKVYFNKNKSNAIHKWLHYFDIYDLYFRKYRNKEISILEIGIYQGGSLKMWRDYFGPKAKIYAIDINPLCKQFETETIKIFIGSQDDRDFLKYIKNQIPKVDILIDDGGHEMHQQIVTFEEMYNHIKHDGIYLCEDLHTSYWTNYGGGYKNPGSFIEYSKNFIDFINAWHIPNTILPINDFTESTYSLHYYDSILVIEKKKIKPPECRITGEIIIPVEYFPTPQAKKDSDQEFINKFKKRIKNYSHLFIHKLGLSMIKNPKSDNFIAERFTPTEKKFLNKKIYIHDIASFKLGYDELFTQEMYKFCAKRINPFIIDCGANLGMSVIYFKELYPGSSIIAFEPDNYIFGFLQKNVKSFGYNNVELINAALWDSEGTISFLAEGGAGGRIETKQNEDNYIKVNTVRLKDFIIKQKVDFLKIDIEGAEYRVIKDCSDVLKDIDFIFVEYHSLLNEKQKLHEILRIIDDAGFRYHIKDAYTSKHPFLNRSLNFGMDLQLNIFCYKD
jgi:FkbM family methyltransferase